MQIQALLVIGVCLTHASNNDNTRRNEQIPYPHSKQPNLFVARGVVAFRRLYSPRFIAAFE